MSLLRDMVGPHGLGRQAEHLLTGAPGGPIVPPPISATRPSGRSASASGQLPGAAGQLGYPPQLNGVPGYGPGRGPNGTFVTPADVAGARPGMGPMAMPGESPDCMTCCRGHRCLLVAYFLISMFGCLRSLCHGKRPLRHCS